MCVLGLCSVLMTLFDFLLFIMGASMIALGIIYQYKPQLIYSSPEEDILSHFFRLPEFEDPVTDSLNFNQQFHSSGYVILFLGLLLSTCAVVGLFFRCFHIVEIIAVHLTLLVTLFLAVMVTCIIYYQSMISVRSWLGRVVLHLIEKHYLLNNTRVTDFVVNNSTHFYANLTENDKISINFTDQWDNFQRDNHCCGVYGAHDYRNIPNYFYMTDMIPKTCCINENDTVCWNIPTVINSYSKNSCEPHIWIIYQSKWKLILFLLILALTLIGITIIFAIFTMPQFSFSLI